MVRIGEVKAEKHHTKQRTKGSEATDPYNLRDRFVHTHKKYFNSALTEIERGQKQGCWSWYIFPVPPYVVNGRERGSGQNMRYALRDHRDGATGDAAALAYLQFDSRADGINTLN